MTKKKLYLLLFFVSIQSVLCDKYDKEFRNAWAALLAAEVAVFSLSGVLLTFYILYYCYSRKAVHLPKKSVEKPPIPPPPPPNNDIKKPEVLELKVVNEVDAIAPKRTFPPSPITGPFEDSVSDWSDSKKNSKEVKKPEETTTKTMAECAPPKVQTSSRPQTLDAYSKKANIRNEPDDYLVDKGTLEICTHNAMAADLFMSEKDEEAEEEEESKVEDVNVRIDRKDFQFYKCSPSTDMFLDFYDELHGCDSTIMTANITRLDQ